MKINTKLMLVLTFMLVATSCNDSEVIVEQPNVNSGITTDKCRQVSLTPDAVLHKEQSSFENMLTDQIIYRDSAYILNISKEEAIDLTIPDSLYVLYLKIVDDLNTHQ